MSVYRLLWELLKHVLHRRGRDEVFVAINWDGGFATGSVTEFRWESDADAFCMIESESEEQPYLYDAPPGIDASLGGGR